MITMLTILTDREWTMLCLGSVVYVSLLIVTILNSRRKVLSLQERLNKVRAMQDEQLSTSRQRVEMNRQRIAELEDVIRRLGDENSMLRLELEEQKARLDYANTMARIENEKRAQAETVIFGSDIYLHIKKLLSEGHPMADADWQQLEQVVNSVYTNFTEHLFSLYPMNDQDYHVTLLVKIRLQPKDIATLTIHSKESVATTRSRLYQKVFGRKGSSKDWDDFVLGL